jgi:transcriptional regulator with XRE-family HTH domain
MTSEVGAARCGRRYARGMTEVVSPSRVGSLLRDWRRRRRLSQLDLALEAGVSARHVSFVETGRSRPSAEMVLLLAEQLDVPLRDRNQLLLAAGYAPVYGQRGLEEPEMAAVRDTLELVLRGHEPYPAVVLDRHWGMVAGNRAVGLLTEGVAPELLEPPVNVLRLSLRPDGIAPRIANLAEWRGHLLDRLGRQAVSTGDPALAALYEELSRLPSPPQAGTLDLAAGEIAVPLRLRAGDAVLSFISTNTTFGTATDITLAELSIESFFPADAETAAAVGAFAGRPST